jgi:hypothetical protein
MTEAMSIDDDRAVGHGHVGQACAVRLYSRGSQTPQYGKINGPNLDQRYVVFFLDRSIPDAPPPLPLPSTTPLSPRLTLFLSHSSSPLPPSQIIPQIPSMYCMIISTSI